ncbi:MAG TPA: hypothetical protein VE778_06140 [Candidatus Bathyarchaeia archaeon]|jgi:excisionase family DNA binding protein|nr:hypothetical protein [Candidatus Bathyarchaeia archaeon]
MPHKKLLAVSPAIALDPSQTAYNTRQAAVYLGLTCWQVRTAIWTGKLPAKRVGRDLIIRRADADAYLAGLPNVEPNSAQWLAKRQAASS